MKETEEYKEMFQLIKEIQQALTDKKLGGRKLDVNETGMLIRTSEIIKKISQ